MGGKFFCGMITGVIVGSAAGMIAKCALEKKDTCKIKKKAKKLINKMERYVNDNMSY
jgi:gas vesicle protein